VTPDNDPYVALTMIGAAIVRAMASADWGAVRDRLIRVVERRDARRAVDLRAQLDDSQRALAAGRTNRDDAADMWQTRLQRLAAEHPSIAHDLARVVQGPTVFGDHPLAAGRDINTGQKAGWGGHIGNKSVTKKSALGGTLVALVALVVMAAVLWPRIAPAQGEPETPAVLLDVVPASGARGDKVTIDGQGFEPGERIQLTFHVAPAGRVEADGDGKFTAKVKVPQGAMALAGQSPVMARGEKSGRAQTFAFMLEGSPFPPS
jgi:hypothetical protein